MVKLSVEKRIDQILDYISQATYVTDNGEVASSVIGLLPYYVRMIRHLIGHQSGITARALERTIRDCVIDLIRDDELTWYNLNAKVNREVEIYKKTSVRKFIILTSINIKYFVKLWRRSINDCVIVFLSNVPKKFTQPNDLIYIDDAEDRFPMGHTVVTIHTYERNAYDAAQTAFDALDLTRGIWNLLLNRGREVFTLSGKPKPINSVRAGPIHTVHEATGKPTTEDCIWYDPGYVKSSVPTNITTTYDNLRENEKVIREKIRTHDEKGQVSELVREYARALDDVDNTRGLLRLWALLEKILGSPGKSENVIERVMPLVENPEKARVELRYIRDLRNTLVHKNWEEDSSELEINALKKYVDTVLLARILWVDKLRTNVEFCKFLELPISIDKLREQVRLLVLAERYHSTGKLS